MALFQLVITVPLFSRSSELLAFTLLIITVAESFRILYVGHSSMARLDYMMTYITNDSSGSVGSRIGVHMSDSATVDDHASADILLLPAVFVPQDTAFYHL